MRPRAGPRTKRIRTESDETELAREKIKESGIFPKEELVLRSDPAGNSLWWAIRYVLSIRTNVLLIIASGLGYFFFSGLRAFGMIFITQHYGISRSTASALVIVLGIGAIAGAVGGGRLADALLARRWINARVIVPGFTLFLSALLFAPGIWTTSVLFAIILFTLAALALGASNPPLDAARLDIIHPRLWGRAESVRTTLRMSLEGAAPIIFGLVSQYVFGGRKSGLEYTFLIMLIPVIIASSLAIPARRTYPRDVATAAASAEATYGD